MLKYYSRRFVRTSLRLYTSAIQAISKFACEANCSHPIRGTCFSLCSQKIAIAFFSKRHSLITPVADHSCKLWLVYTPPQIPQAHLGIHTKSQELLRPRAKSKSQGHTAEAIARERSGAASAY